MIATEFLAFLRSLTPLFPLAMHFFLITIGHYYYACVSLFSFYSRMQEPKNSSRDQTLVTTDNNTLSKGEVVGSENGEVDWEKMTTEHGHDTRNKACGVPRENLV